MTKKTKFHTDVSKMRFNGRVNQAYWNGGQAMRMIYNNIIVFNRAEYHLDVPETVELEAVGTKDEPLSNFIGIESYKIDYDGTRSEITYRGGSDKIAANNTTEPKEGEYIITQEWSALQISGKWTQVGKEFMHYSFKQIRSVSVNYDEALAGGGDVEPYVSINVWLLEHWSDESTVDKYVSYRGSVTSATGKVISDNAVGSYSTINGETGVVTVPSLGTTVKDARDVFTVESLSGTVTIPDVDDGKVVEWNWGSDEDYNVKQMENYKHDYGTPTYKLESSVEHTELEASQKTVVVNGTAVKTSYYYYDSAPSEIKSATSKATLYVTNNDDNGNILRLEGSNASVSFDVGKNTSKEKERTFKIRVYNTDLDYDESYTVTQAKKEFMHYSFKQIRSVSVDYEEAYAGGGDFAPYVSVDVWLLEHWSDESTVNKYVTYIGVVTSATGKVISDNVVGTKSTINAKTGVVTIPSLGTTEKAARDVFTVETLGGTITIPIVENGKVVSWNWNKGFNVKQMENYKRDYGTPKYTLNSSVSTTELNAVDTSFKVTGSAFKTSDYYYDSNPTDIKSTDTNETLYVLLDDNVNDARHLVGKDASTTFTVGVNTSIESARTFKARVYNTGLGYDKTHTITQKKNSMTTYWTTPVLNGDIVIENILANGSGVYISIPIKQQKYGQVEGVATDTLLETFTGSVFATGVVGTVVDGTGATFKDGMMSANSMGTTIYPSGRTVYKLSSVKVTGKDDKSHTLQLPAIIEIKQNKNEKYTAYGTYALSVSADPTTGIANTGGTSKISATAQQNVTYTWDSGATPVDDKINVKGTLTTTVGTLSADSITGSGSATLTFGENIAAARTATITLAVGENKKTCTVSQNAVSYVLTKGEDKECNATASTINVSFTSSRNGSAWEPTFTANLSGVTFGTISHSGTTYTVPVNVPENKDKENRDIVITATQSRYDGNKTAQVIITQAAAAADNRPKAAFMYIFQYTDANKSSVSYSVYFDASKKKDGDYIYQGGKFTDVVIQLNTKSDGSGNVLGDSAELGDITVSQGGTSKTHSGTIKAGQSCYVRVYYDNTWQLATPPDEYIPEE